MILQVWEKRKHNTIQEAMKSRSDISKSSLYKSNEEKEYCKNQHFQNSRKQPKIFRFASTWGAFSKRIYIYESQ